MSRSLARLAHIVNPFVLLFVLSAWLGTRSAYATAPAQHKFALLLAAVGVYVVLALLQPRRLPLLLALFGLVSIVAALHFWLAHDWAARPVKFAALNEVGAAWQAVRPNWLPPTFNGNVQGGIAASFLPLLLLQLTETRRWFVRMLTGIAAAFVLATIVFASSRGAWLALAGWGIVGLIGARFQPQLPSRLSRTALLVGSVVASIAAVALLFGQQLSDSFNFPSRLGLYTATAYLIGDFPLIGGGLDTFRGLYSYYIAVTPHMVVTNAHNLWLDVWVEQGVLGSVALLGLFATAFWQLFSADNRYKWPLLTSGGILVTHSQIENLVYGTEYTPLLLTLPAFALLASQPVDSARRRWTDQLIMAALPLCILLFIYPNAWRVNQAAIDQARIDLVDYPTGEWDKRRPDAWRSVTHQWRTLLQADPTNRTANHRLGLISLQGRQFDAAAAYFETALAAAPHHRGIQKNLGYAYAWSNQPAQALEHLTLAMVNSAELNAYGGWWNTLDRSDLAATAFQLSEQLLLQESR